MSPKTNVLGKAVSSYDQKAHPALPFLNTPVPGKFLIMQLLQPLLPDESHNSVTPFCTNLNVKVGHPGLSERRRQVTKLAMRSFRQ